MIPKKKIIKPFITAEVNQVDSYFHLLNRYN